MTAARTCVIAHWRGELSLAKSFLVNGVLGYIVFVAVGLGLWQFVTWQPADASGLVLFLAWMVWATVGIVRSAFRTYREPRSTFGPVVARRGFAVLAIVLTAAFVYYTLADARILFR